MRIRRLEIHGFKSFADRTVFHFVGGISCVVGPNGCGKSNVVDALKWVIGEQSAKSLRGGDMQDVIFAGSSDRKPVGYAEVGLTLSGEGGEPFPGEFARFSEIHLARRLYRSGVSEYLINQARCRRKDIVDLIMDSGVGNNLYSFIEQGRIDKIVSASPMERRSLIDEAAGITRYKQRRAEAQVKLEATASQLDRAADVAEEMSRRLGALERQVVRAARYRRLNALIRQEEIFLGLVKYAGLTGERSELAGELARLGSSVERLEVEVDRLEEDAEVRRGEAEVAESAEGVARDALAEVDAQRREVEATLGLHARRCEELRESLRELLVEVEREGARATTAAADLERSQAGFEAVEEEAIEAEEAASQIRARHGVVAQDRERAQAEAREAEMVASRQAEARAEARARWEGLRGRLAELPVRIAELERRLEESGSEAIVLDKRAQVATEAMERSAVAIEELEASAATAEEALDAAVRRDVHTRDAVAHAERELDAAQAELGQAIAKAETSAGMADEEVAAEVARVQQTEDRRLAEVERDAAREIGGRETAMREALAAAELRARKWLDETRRQLDGELAGRRRAIEQGFEQTDLGHQRSIDEAVSALSEQLQLVEARHRAELDERLEQAGQHRARGEGRLEEARKALQNAEARLAVTVRERRELEGRQAALRAEEAAVRARDAGAAAVSEALGGASTLVEVLEVADEARSWFGAALGSRLMLPVVTLAADVLRAAEVARKAGATAVLWSPKPPTLEGLLQQVAVVEDLPAALAHHERVGGAAVVRSSGERVEADGLVRLGAVAADTQDALARREELERLEGGIEALREAERELAGQITEARAQVEAATITVRAAISRAEQAEREGREALKEALRVARAEGEARVREVREAAAAWRGAARKELEQRVAEAISARDRSLDEVRSQGELGVVGLREHHEREVMAAREASERARDLLREASVARVDEARKTAWDRVRATTGDIQVRREALRQRVDVCREELEAARERSSRSGARVKEARTTVEGLRARVSEQRVVFARLEVESAGARAQRVTIDERVAGLRLERTALTGELERSQQQSTTAEAVFTEAEQRAQEAARRLEEARGRADQLEGAGRQTSEARELAERRLAECNARRVQLDAAAQTARRQLLDAQERVAVGTRRQEELQARLNEASEQLASASSIVNELSDRRQEASLKFENARGRRDLLRAAAAEVERTLRQKEGELTEQRRDLLAAEQADQKAAAELAAVVERVEERYQIDLAHDLHHLRERSGLRLEVSDEAGAGITVAGKTVEPVEALVLRPEMLHDEAMVRRVVGEIAEHRAELDRIKDVNLTALEEYTELNARFQDLDAQREDLETSVGAIRSAIAKMNRTCRERFRETFDRVDQEFRRAYPDLVGGGEARLALTDEEDLLETGVEIFVRPPGKRLQNLTLLSGGEKAMTAIALLLALFTVKPSPFCVLDEVDAPLDEANGARFNDMLRQMSAMTQFIVVTHNRKTMECADTLYGITMPTPGCSSLVSVEVEG
jgi:chromosome segregation protein